LDTSVWLAYFIDGLYKDIIDSEKRLLVSVLTLFEVKKVLLSREVDKKIIEDSISYIKRRCLIIPVSDSIAEEAGIFVVAKDCFLRRYGTHIKTPVYLFTEIQQRVTFTTEYFFRHPLPHFHKYITAF